ncbi:hypothetical protein H632_c932p0 [Helicosporidium sp. ATCC 50920]|nr:hypothetical protein H632_c932p0 [Helicosporidium sp. ATCC 50920]|eukprot:KDD75001.1 hypothetical protein H632_c932p0 [Helicosporidium sp. ATCC 50920]
MACLLPSLTSKEYHALWKELADSRQSLVAPDGRVPEVAIELLKYLDDGDNPDTFTDDIFRAGLVANQVSKGKFTAFRKLEESLSTHLEAKFPEEWQEYQTLRKGDE